MPQMGLFFDWLLNPCVNSIILQRKINYGAYADTISHLHMHIVPKYKDGYGFGGVFEMNPQKTYLSEAEYKETIDKLLKAL